MLSEGELQTADDAYYKPGDPALYKVKGRTAFDAAGQGAAEIDGLGFAQFDGATDLLVKMQGQTYYTATAGTGGSSTWTSRQTSLNASAILLNPTHYLNEHYLLNGFDRYVLSSDATIRQHGMAPVQTAPTIVTSAAGNMSPTTGLKYWTTEVVLETAGDVTSAVLRESEFDTTSDAVDTGVLSSKKVVVTKPATVNTTDANAWRVYVSSDDGSYPTGGLLATIVIGTTTYEDDRTDITIPSTAYPILTISIAGVSASVSKNTQPPLADVGDIYEDSLVINDTSDITRVRYSFPDDPDVFPSLYFISMETARNDEVMSIVQIGNVCLVLTKEQVWRINYLPREQDAEFDRGRARDRVSGAIGSISKRGAVVFEMPGSGQMVGYISASGPMLTNGFVWNTMSDDLDWEATVNTAQLGNCVLTNNPRLFRLELDYAAVGSDTNNKTMYFHYHPTHIKGGATAQTSTQARSLKLKLSGPVNRAASSVAGGFVSNVWQVWTGHVSDGKVYNEWSGNKDNSSAGGISFKWETGDMYLAQHGNEFIVRRYGLHHKADSQSYTQTVTITAKRESRNDVVRTKEMSLKKRELTMEAFQVSAEAVILGGTNTNDNEPTSVNFCVIDADGMGKSEE